MAGKAIPTAVRLERRSVLLESGCIEWTGYRLKVTPEGRGGYGTILHNGRKVTASRAAWEVAHGPVPKGMVVCHKCDNRACINLEHLFVGTYRENTQDMYGKGRAAIGSLHGTAKLNEDVVRWVRTARMKDADIARKLGVTQATICNIKKRKTWKHVA